MSDDLPRGLTITILDNRGAEVVITVKGSHRYVATILAKAGQLALMALLVAEPGQEKRFDFVQGRGMD